MTDTIAVVSAPPAAFLCPAPVGPTPGWPPLGLASEFAQFLDWRNPRSVCLVDRRFCRAGTVVVGRREWMRFGCLFICVIALPCWAQSYTANEWKRQIVVKLQSNVRFPGEACGKSGEAKVAFTLDRTGKLVSTKIVSGTGVPALDDAALEIVKSAQPFPLAPPEVADGDLTLVAPLVFAKPASTSSCDLWSEQRLRGVMRSICRGC
jgi:TonB family protein